MQTLSNQKQGIQEKIARPIPSSSQSVERCYAEEKKFPEKSQNAKSYAFLHLRISGEEVQGEYEYYPWEKDSTKGNFIGFVGNQNRDSYFIVSRYTYESEGVVSQEEKYFIIDEEFARIAYGEMVKKADGEYRYKDPQALDFNLSIPRVSCDDYKTLHQKLDK